MSDLPLYPDAVEPASTPTLDQILGAPPKPPTLDEILSKRPSDDLKPANSWITAPFESTIVPALKRGWGGSAELSPETEKTLKDWGLFNDYEKGQNSIIRRFNEGLLRPAIAAADIAFSRIPGAVHEMAVETPGLQPLAALMEAFPAGHVTSFPARVAPPAAAVPREAAPPSAGELAAGRRARLELTPSGIEGPTERVVAPGPRETVPAANDLFGEWDGTAAPAAPSDAEIAATGAAAHASRTTPDVHAAARQIAPDTFSEYDELAGRRDTLQRWLGDLAEQRDRGSSPHIAAVDDRIEELRSQRLEAPQNERAGLANQITALEEQRAGLVAELPKVGDTAEMGIIRRDLTAARNRMFEMQPEVSDAYRRAQEGGAAPAPEGARPPQPDTVSVPIQEAAARPAGALEPLPAPEIAATPETPVPATAPRPAAAPEAVPATRAPIEGGIAGDQARELVAAGRPAEEAQAAGAVVQAYYETRAARFGGAKGTAEDLYRAEAATVRAGRGARAAMEMAQRGELEQPAFHGSPYVFDKFTLDHIGKGEGAQAYGHGLYFASERKVAEYYRQTLSRWSLNPQIIHDVAPDLTPAQLADVFNSTVINLARDESVSVREAAAHIYAREPGLRDLDGRAPSVTGPHPTLERVVEAIRRQPRPGRLYHVDIAPEPHEFLDWDKPLSEQSEQVRAAIMPLLSEEKRAQLAAGKTRLDSGADLYHDIAERLAKPQELVQPEGSPRGWGAVTGGTLSRNGKLHDPAAASEALRRADVRGIRYQDQGSRGSEGGSHNFVIFDANDIAIREFEQPRRGKIRLATDDARATITLFKDADASTFIHETGHDWLEQMVRDAADQRAPPDLKADAQTVRRWLDVDEGAEIPTRAHEKFARGFERYMMEGHAPSEALAGVFAKFKEWLTKIYQTVSRLRAPVTDDIRGVFDRMLATKDERPVIAPEREAGIAETRLPSREFVTAAPGARGRSPAYESVPREPPRLVDWLKKAGGLRDDTFTARVNTARGRADAKANPSEIRTIADDPKARGLIRAKAGMSHDDAALRAWEAGYFPEFTERPTINDLYEAIQADLNGYPRYSAHDAAARAAYSDAMARNHEIDRIGDALGVNPREYTREQFFDMAAEHLSKEEQAREIGSMDAAAELAFKEAERRAKEWVESRGDAWEPDAFYDIGEPRTAEAMESDYKQATESAGNAREGAGGAGEPGAAAADPGSLQAGVRQGGRDIGVAGRASESAGEAAPEAGPRTGTDTRTGSAAGGVVDRTAWINRLNTTADAKNIILEMSARTQDFRDARFGQAAYQLYHDARAARQLVEEISQATVEAGTKWANSGAEADAVAYARASQQLLMASELYSEIKAGWGRAGHAFQRIDRIAAGQSVADYVKRITGRTLDQLIQERDLSQALPDADARAKFIGDTRLTRWQRIRGGYLSYFINNLISGPITHGGYAVGNTTLAAFKATADTSWAAAIDSMREMIAGKPLDDRVHWAEVPAQLYGAVRGWRDGWGAAGEALKTGVPYMKGVELISQAAEGVEFPGMGQAISRPQAIPGKVGYVLETPSRAVTAIHTLFYSMGYEQEIARLAVRSAMKSGLEGDVFNGHVAEFTQNPPLEAIEHAHDEALAMVLMKRPAFGSAMSNIQRSVNGNIVAKTMLPFMQIGANILDQAFVQHTPLAFASQAARDNLLGRNGAVAQSLQYGKIAAGTMLSGIVIGLAAEEIITGGGPSDPHERMRKELTGWKPYSIRIGDHYWPYRKLLGPLGALVGGVANMYEVGHTAGTDGFASAASAAIFGFSQVVADETWLRGLSDFINAARNWDKDGGRYLRNLGADFVPFAIGMGQMAQLIDPYQREVHSFTDAIKNKIPLLRQTLDPRNDFYGQPITQHTMVGPSASLDDPVTAALIRLDIPIAPITRKIDGVGLDDRQYAELTQVGGRLVKMRLDEIVGRGNFASLPLATQRDMITRNISAAHKQARALIMAQDHSIIEAARAAKDAYRQGASHKQKLELLKGPAGH